MAGIPFVVCLKLLLVSAIVQFVIAENDDISTAVAEENSDCDSRITDLQARVDLLENEYLTNLTMEGIAFMPRNCSEAIDANRGSGRYTISIPESDLRPFAVYCLEDKTDLRPWTIVQRRLNNKTDFYRSWEDYKHGFEGKSGNLFIGLERLHALTNDPKNPQELWVQLTDNETASGLYSRFVIGSEYERYPIKELGTFVGPIGDSLRRHLNMKFTTRDYDNDMNRDLNCAQFHHGAWWYADCAQSNLNGLYGSTSGNGMFWQTFRGAQVSMSFTQMAIRPARKLRNNYYN